MSTVEQKKSSQQRETRKDQKTKEPDTGESSGASNKLDNFDPAALRLDQNYKNGVRKLVTTIPVKKPPRHSFFRTHDEPSMRLETTILEDKTNREYYLIAPALRDSVLEQTPVCLYTAQTRQGVNFLWPCKLPSDGRILAWHTSAIEAAEVAMKRWIRVAANMDLAAYEIYEAGGDLPEPVWPQLSLKELLTIAFRDRFISDLNHPILREQRGEI